MDAVGAATSCSTPFSVRKSILDAECVGRRALAMDIEPRLIVHQRWQAFDRKDAVYGDSDLTFDKSKAAAADAAAPKRATIQKSSAILIRIKYGWHDLSNSALDFTCDREQAKSR